jgi:hypothetical protein
MARLTSKQGERSDRNAQAVISGHIAKLLHGMLDNRQIYSWHVQQVQKRPKVFCCAQIILSAQYQTKPYDLHATDV